MRILPTLPTTMVGRHQQNSVAIHCECKTDFIWPKSGGDSVTCPGCRKNETLDVANAPPLTPSIGD